VRRRDRLALACALIATLALGLAPTASAHARHHHQPPQPANIVQTAQAAGQFHTLLALLDKTGLTSTLEGPGPFTVFAPTDAAFAKLPQSTLDALAADPATLKKILLYHVVSGAVSSSAAAAAGSATTVEGENVTFTSTPGGGLEVNGSNIVTADIAASNGVIHAIDTVLTPPSLAPAPKTIVDVAVASGQFTTLVKLLQATGLDSVLEGAGPFTVFAPTDAAFAKLPQSTLDALAANPALLKQVLLYHVVSGTLLEADLVHARHVVTAEGDSVRIGRSCGPRWWFGGWGHWWNRWHPGHCSAVHVNDATIVAPDVLASNGVIQAVDTVLMPPTHS
jgi:uncharacterized surface protein with fasciclin (FAS1) repeats